MAKTADIIARLTLNGAQFSSESARVFGAMEAASRASSDKVASSFATTIEKVQAIAGKGVGLNLTGLREGASSATATAAAMNTVAAAAESVALKAGGADAALNAQATSMRRAAEASAKRAATLMVEANAWDALQTELNQNVIATDAATKGQLRLTQSMDTIPRSARGSQMAMVQASQQFQDFFIQVGGGQSVMVAFAQQASQLAYVMQNAGGGVGKFAGIMSSFKGTAVLAALTIGSMLIPKLLGTSDAAERSGDSVAKSARKTDNAAAAQRAYAATLAGVIDAIKKTTEAYEAQNRSIEDNARIAAQAAATQLRVGQSQRFRASLELGGVQRDLNAARGDALSPNIATAGAGKNRIAQLESREAELKANISAFDRQLANAEANIRSATMPLIDKKIEQSMTAEGRAAGALTDKLNELAKARRAGTLSEREYSDGLFAARKANAGELERLSKLRAVARPTKKIELLAPVEGRVSSGFGLRDRPTAGASAFHKGMDFAVPSGTSVRAGADGVVIKTGTAGGLGKVVWIDYGNKNIAEFNHLSNNSMVKEGQAVSRGQVIGKSGNTGVSTGPHLDYRLKVAGAYVDPRGRKVNVGAGVGDAAGDYERDPARDLKRETEERERIVVAIQQGLTLEVEATRYVGLRVRGLKDQGEEEKRVAEIRREGAEHLAALPAKQKRVTDGLDDQIARYVAQGDQLAGLLRSHGERETLTVAEKAAEEQVLTAMEAQLTAALALAKTAADQLRIKEALAKVQVRLGNAEGAGDAAGRETARAQEKAAKDCEEFLKDQRRAQQDQIEDMAYFYERAFSSGGKSIWEDFKRQGMRTLALIAAQWTQSLLMTGKLPSGNILSQIGATANAGGGGDMVSSLLGLVGAGPSRRRGGSYGGGVTGGMAPGGLYAGGGGDLSLGGLYGGVGGNLFRDVGASGAGATRGAGGLATVDILGNIATGMAISQVVSRSGGMGSMVGGSIGSVLGKVAGNAIGKGIGGALGSAAGPIGSILGSVAGSLLGGLLGGKRKVEKGSTIITGTDTDRVRYGRVATGGLADSVQDGLKKVIEALGATESAFKVAIGMRDGKYVVDTTGAGNTRGAGTTSFASEQEAIKFAIMDALKDGAMAGISAAAKNILAAGKDLDKAIEKALRIEDIPKRLAAIVDPVGSAIGKFEKEWKKTIDALREGGASAAQMAEAQKLYKIELEATKASAREASATLKEFLAGINFGSASPYSLRDQEGLARATLQPFLDKIAAGESIDQGRYTEAAGKFLEIERELYGSTGKYFEELDRIKGATGAAITRIDEAVPVRTYVDPFVEATASNTATANDLLAQIGEQQAGTNNLLAELLARGPSGGGGGFIGGGGGGGSIGVRDRMFVRSV